MSELRQRATHQNPSQARGRAFIPRPREAARATTIPPEEGRSPTLLRGGPPEDLRHPSHPEGRESPPTPLGVPTSAKGKGKTVSSSEPPPSVEKLSSPPSLEVLMSDPSLF